MEEIASRVGVGRTTLYRALDRTVRTAAAGTGNSAGHDEMTGRQRRTPGRKPRPSAAAT